MQCRSKHCVYFRTVLDPTLASHSGEKMLETIKRGTAGFIQVIHTNKYRGIWDRIGDVDIYVDYYEYSRSYRDPLGDSHNIAFFIHLGTVTKKLYIVADLNENGDGTVVKRERGRDRHRWSSDLEIGLYAPLNESLRGKRLFVKIESRQGETFWDGIGQNFSDPRLIISDTASTSTQRPQRQQTTQRPQATTRPQPTQTPQVVGNDEEEEDECTLCCVNKRNAYLSPCGHQYTCVDCWNTWKRDHRSRNQCPYCRQNVEECIERDLFSTRG